MRTFLMIVAPIVTVFIGAGTAWYLYALLWKPELATVSTHELRRWPAWQRYLFYSAMGASFFGVGFMIYKGVEGAFWFVPRSWRSTNNDGESEWIVHSAAFVISFYVSILSLGKLSELAGERVKLMRGSDA